MACTIQEPSLFLDSPPGHTPPASLPLSMPRVAVKRRWTQLPALWCTESLLSSCCRNNICSPFYGLQDLSLPYLIMPPPPHLPPPPFFPVLQPHWPSSLSLPLPQGLCTCHFCSLENAFPNFLMTGPASLISQVSNVTSSQRYA